MISIDETAAVKQSQQGDVHAFNRLVEHYKDRVYAVCYWLLGDVHAAEDASQETFRAAFRAIQRFDGGSFVAWLLRNAKNECYDQLRTRRPQISLDTSWKDGGAGPRHCMGLSEAPEEQVLRADLERTLEQQLLALPLDERLVVVLRDVHGYSYPEIAVTTGWPVDTIKSRLGLGRTQLRIALRAHQAVVITAKDLTVCSSTMCDVE